MNYPRICLEGLRKATNNHSRDSQSPGSGTQPEPPEYKAGTLVILNYDALKLYFPSLLRRAVLEMVANIPEETAA
jgi:hypothetical protein